MIFNLLGKVELFDDNGTPVQLSTKKVALVLAILALSERGEYARDQLSSLVWPGKEDSKARESLRTALATLRRILPEGSLLSFRDTVRLKGGSITCDVHHTDEPWDFMPGFDSEWVIETRFELQTRAAEKMLSRVTELCDDGLYSEALTFAERACKIDPHSAEAAEARVRILNRLDRQSEAAAISVKFRNKVLRELGVLADVGQEHRPKDLHPIRMSAEWVLERNPSEAVQLLIATKSHWFSSEVDTALDIHERALRAAPRHVSGREILKAHRYYLLWVAGRLNEVIEPAQQFVKAAAVKGEKSLACLCGAVASYSFLSKGDFKSALRFARSMFALAERSDDQNLICNARLHRANIEQHVGNFSVAMLLRDQNLKSVIETGSAQEVAECQSSMVSSYLATANYELASESLLKSKRYFEASGGTRMKMWVQLGEAELCEAIGDWEGARAHMSEIIGLGAGICGHSLAAAADDGLARVDCRLGDFSSAAQAYGRAAALRRKLGTVKSVAEHRASRNTKLVLEERVGKDQLRARYRQALVDIA